MNGKRQTIWLVSMLSLMVVLSAYYLFTEDSGASIPKDTAGTMQVDSLKDTAGAALPTVGDKGVVVNEVVSQGDVVADEGVVDSTTGAATTDDSATAAKTDDSAATAKTDDSTTTAKTDESTTTAAKDDSSKAAANSSDSEKATTDTAAKDAAKTDTSAKDTAANTTTKTPAKNDKEILDEVASQSVSASSMFTNYLYEREQKNLKNQQDLLALINDMDKTPADNAVAQEQLLNLEEKESKIRYRRTASTKIWRSDCKGRSWRQL